MLKLNVIKDPLSAGEPGIALLRDFLFYQLGQYGDPIEDIEKCLRYAFSTEIGKGGLVMTAQIEEQLIGVSVINHTNMGGYIPKEHLVYFAVHEDFRNQGIGTKLLQFTLQQCPGAMALHVECDNPARFLYEKMGFCAKYIEMRIPEEAAHG